MLCKRDPGGDTVIRKSRGWRWIEMNASVEGARGRGGRRWARWEYEARRASQVVKLRGASLNLTQRYLTARTGGGAVSTRDGRGTEEATSW